MKNKKLFAILTLVCFMFTLMPVAAFAAEEEAPFYYDDQVYVKVDGEWVTEGDVEIKTPFELGVGLTDGSDVTTESYVFYALNEDGNGVALNRADGTMVIGVEGDYTVYAINVDGYDVEEVTGAIDTVANKVDTLVSWARGLGLIVDEYAEVSVEAPDTEWTIELGGDAVQAEDAEGNVIDGVYNVTIHADGGWTTGEGEIRATLSNNSNNKVSIKNRELTFSAAGYVDLAFEDGKTTDGKGTVDFEVTSEYAGDYKVIVKYEDAKATLNVHVSASAVDSVAVYTEPTAPVNADNAIVAADIEFIFSDASGAAYTAEDLNYDDEYKIVVVDQPAKSKMEGKDFVLIPDVDNVDGVWTLQGADADDKFEDEGKYTIKVVLENGASATATVEVAKMGDVVGIKFYKAPVTVVYGATTQVAQGITLVDANGVTDTLMADEETGAIDGVEFSVAGKAVKSLNTTYLTAKDDEDYIGSKITVYAVYEDFVVSTDITVTDAAASIIYTDKTAEVAVNNTIVGTILDSVGKYVSLGNSVKDEKAIVLDKPENAVAVATVEYDSKKGVMLNLLASEAGEYEIQTIITYTDNMGTPTNTADDVVRYLTSVDTFTVGAGNKTFEDIVVVSIGADKMIVNSEVVALDVAPFITNGRTMMQFNVLYVFGIDVDWVAETQSIVAEGNGLKVVMQLGSKVATVNGEEVALDVAPYTVNGRTVVPVGFITGLLDITPVFTYNADGTIADILFAK